MNYVDDYVDTYTDDSITQERRNIHKEYGSLNNSTADELYIYNQSLQMSSRNEKQMIQQRRRARRLKFLVTVFCCCCFLPVLCALIMVAVVHVRCHGGQRLSTVIDKSFAATEVHSLNIHAIAADVQIVENMDDIVSDRVYVTVTMTGPDQKYLERIQSNINFMGDTLSLTITYFSNYYFGCPKNYIVIKVPPRKQLGRVSG
jgi:hypothetical protein